MEILYVILALILGIAVGCLATNGKKQALATKAEMLSRQLSEAKEEQTRLLGEAKAEQERRLAAAKDEYNRQTELMEKRLQSQIELLQERFTTASEKELKARTRELSAFNTEQLSKILAPLNERIAQMREAADKNRQVQTETTAQLGEAINRTFAQTEKLGKTTDNLVNALSRNNSYQGNFGEMQLRRLLENMGFERGKQFDEQVTLRDDIGQALQHDETGRRMQPDVILHFPDRRDIIIDAKTSMNAFMRYNDAALPEIERRKALKDHVAAIKTQVNDLSKKDYWRQYNQKGIKLDFVVMFIPSDAAYSLAVSQDPALWQDAFAKGVFITNPQNLYAMLRLLEISWKQVAQVENQQNIIDCANEIVKRVQIFYERLQKVGNEFEKVQKSFSDLSKTVAPRGASIISSANKLISYGAHEDTTNKNRSLPRENALPPEAADTE